MTRVFNVPMLSRKEVALNTYEVGFDFSKEKFEFTAGQYITVTVPGLEHLESNDQFREFSIISSPSSPELVTIVFRKGLSDFKKQLLSVPMGTRVIIEGPKGLFTLPPETHQPIICVAGGVGIAPFLSMARFIYDSRQNYQMTLLYFNADRQQAAYIDELEKYQPLINFQSIYQRLQIEDFQQLSIDLPTAIWYLAGPPGMVGVAQDLLIQLGVKKSSIQTEKFTGEHDES